MAIAFSCHSCGRTLKVKDDLSGKQIYCPDCKQILSVPAADAEPTADDAVPMAERDDDAPEGYREEPSALPRPPRRDLVRDEEDWDDDEVRRKRRKREQTSGGNSSSGTSAIVGGIVMMLVAVIWFVAGLAFDTLFCYPPILFIIGMIALIKGIFSAATGRD